MLNSPSEPVRLAARVTALLLPYYEKDTPQGIRNIEAEDWAEELAEFPEWAVRNAARWWKSSDNPDRRKRPLEGDISARCRVELDAVYAAQRIATGPIVKEAPEVDRQPVSDLDKEERKAAADKILSDFGFSPAIKKESDQ